MAQKDLFQRLFMSRPECAADICNLFFGSEIVFAGDLSSVDPNVVYKGRGTQKKLGLVSRDNLVRWVVGNVLFALIGIESQSASDVDMVVRVFVYDALSYKSQKRNKSGKRVPVVTFVVYYGEKPWTGPRTLRECVEFLGGTEKIILPFFNDFKLNILDFHTIPVEKILAMKSDFRYIATFLYNAAHRDASIPFPPVEDVEFIQEFLQIFSNTKHGKKFPIVKLSNEKLKQGGYGMNELLMSYINAEVNDRVAAIVPVQVAEQVAEQVAVTRKEDWLAFEQRMKRSARTMASKGIPYDEIADVLGFDLDTINAWLDEKQA